MAPLCHWWCASRYQYSAGPDCKGLMIFFEVPTSKRGILSGIYITVYIYNMWKYIYVCLYVWMYACMHCMHGMFGMHGMHGMFGMHGWYVRTYACMSVCLYVCMYVWTFQKRCQSWWNLNLKLWCLSLNSVLLGVFSAPKNLKFGVDGWFTPRLSPKSPLWNIRLPEDLSGNGLHPKLQ